MLRGKIFTPRGLTGIHKAINAELRLNGLLTRNGMIEEIKTLDSVSRLRIPQSVWVPLIECRIDSRKDFTSALDGVDWSALPSLKSHGPRITITRDSATFDDDRARSELLQEFRHRMMQYGLEKNEFSIRIDHENILSVQTNAVPPRPWLDSPMDLTLAEKSIDWGSVNPDVSRPTEPSDNAIKIFRNESSLSCLCAGFLQSTPGLTDWINGSQENMLVWDPFAGNGSLLMELVQFLSDRPAASQKDLTIVINVKTRESLRLIERRLEKWSNSTGIEIQEQKESGPAETISKQRGRKSKQASQDVDDEDVVAEVHVDGRMKSVHMKMGNYKIALHSASVPFQETIPFIHGGMALSHIPKTYNELLGIDKHDLSEWTAFGNLVKSHPKLDVSMFTETDSFIKYSKMKFSKCVQLVSPSGRLVGSFNRWLGI